MDVVKASGSRADGQKKPARVGWSALTLTGAAAFWFANLLISLTPSAAAYRSALSIHYVAMLLEAALGGLVVAGVVAVTLVRFGSRVPGGGPVRRSLLLATCALVLVTLVVEVPAKFGAGIAEPGRWLLVATVFNTVRVLAMGVALGLVARERDIGVGRSRSVATKEKRP